MDKLIVKLTLNHSTTKRLRDTPSTYTELLEAFTSMAKGPIGVISYKDASGDTILVADQDDLETAILCAKEEMGGCVRFEALV